MIVLKSGDEIRLMRKAGRVVAQALDEARRLVAPGVTTGRLDRALEDVIRKAGAEPSFKGYHGFPASICASVNEEVVHGIPGSRRLAEGDIISIDVGAYLNGFHGDAAVTLAVGTVDSESQRLIDVTRAALFRGIQKAQSGGRLSDISHAVQTYVESNGFTVVRDYVGHGIGREMHEAPEVPNFGKPGLGPLLRQGMALAIEPMVNTGGHTVRTLENGWTVVTTDGRRSAHFEHTIVVTDTGPEVLTVLEE